MIDYIVLGIIVVPAVLLLAFRTNAALTFLSLCLGSVLAQVAAGDATQVVGSFAPSGGTVGLNTVALVLLWTPPLLTAIFLIRSMRPRHFLLQLIPAIGVGAAGLLLSRPYLSAQWQQQLEQATIWSKLDGLEVIIIGLSALLCLLAVWVQRPKKPLGKHLEH